MGTFRGWLPVGACADMVAIFRQRQCPCLLKASGGNDHQRPQVPRPEVAFLGESMYLTIAYGLAVATALMGLALLWLGWEHRRAEAKAKHENRVAAQNLKLRQAPQTAIAVLRDS